MARYIGTADATKIGKQTGGKDTEASGFGLETYIDITSISWTVESGAKARPTVGGGVKFKTIIPKAVEITGSIKGRLVDGRALELGMGGLAAGGAGVDHVASISTALSYYTIHSQINATEYGKIIGAKFDGVKLSCSSGEPLNIELGFKALRFSIITATVSGTLPTEKPYEYYHGCVDWNSVTTEVVNSIDVTLSRNTEAKRGIECMTATNQRVMSEIIEKMADISGSATIAVQNSTFLNQALGGTTISDTISTFTIKATFTRDAANDIEVNLTTCAVKSVSGEAAEETGERTVTVSFVALDMSVDINVT